MRSTEELGKIKVKTNFTVKYRFEFQIMSQEQKTMFITSMQLHVPS